MSLLLGACFRKLVVVSAVCCLLVAAAASVQAAELKLAHFTSSKHPMDRLVMTPWSKEVAKRSNGSLTVRIFPGGALGKGPQAQYKRAADGVADITFGLQGYTSSQFPRTLLVELPGLAPDAMAATKMMWKAIGDIQGEYDRTRVVALWTNDKAVIMTRNKAVRTLDDVKGMKIRTPSKLQGDIIKALGATPVSMPVTKMYNALKTGVVDGLMVAPSVIRSFKIGEVAKYYTVGPFANTAFFLAMNRKAYDGLSAEHKKIVDETSGEALSVKAAGIYKKAGAGSLAGEKKSGRGEVITLSDAEDKRFRKALSGVRAATVKALSGKGIDAEKILAAMGG